MICCILGILQYMLRVPLPLKDLLRLRGNDRCRQ